MRTTTAFALLAAIVATGVVASACTQTEYVVGTKKSGTGTGTGDGTDTNGTDPSNPNGSDPAGSDSSNPDAPPGPVASNIAISEIAVFQAVKTDIFAKGAWVANGSRNAPLAANRPARMRVYVAPGSGWTTKDITAELRISSGSTKMPVIHATQSIKNVASTDDDATTLIDIDIPATSLPKDAAFSVALTAADGATPTGDSDARFPTDGTTKPLELQTTGVVKVVLVPVKYMADSSGRMPDTSASMLDAYKQIMMARYPATDVQITVRDAWSYSSSIAASGTGWSQVLNALTTLRQQDGAANDVYYFGAFEPSSSFASYCGSGCVTGLSTVVDSASESQLRASVGIGYTGYDSEETMAHEVGHAHGRNHAPCGGASGVDPSFPYSNGGIGVLGFDIVAKKFYPTSNSTDMMGYCDNNWVSDYTYKALFARVASVNALSGTSSGAGADVMSGNTYEMAHVDMNGDVEWGAEVKLDHTPAGGTMRDVAYVDASGATIATEGAHFYPYDHLPGGVLMVPARDAAWSHVKISGVAKALARR